MDLLVTGCAGFIGSHLCDRLLGDGHRVVGVDSFSDYYDPERKESNLRSALKWKEFRLERVDLAEAALEPLIAEVSGVFHLAGQPGVRASWGGGFETYLRDNVLVTQRLLEALRGREVPMVMASSSSVYGAISREATREDSPCNPISPYGLTKLAAEHTARIYGEQFAIPVVRLRYFTVYGPRQRPDMAFSRFLHAGLLGEPMELMGDGSQTRDFTYVSDIVDATIRSLQAQPGSVYNVGGGSPVTVQTAIDRIGELCGRVPDVTVSRPSDGDVIHTWADNGRARRDLGWAPTVPLREGLALQCAWQRELLSEHAVA